MKTRDAWSGKEVAVTRENFPVYTKEVCSYSGVTVPSGAEVSPLHNIDPSNAVKCPGCNSWKYVRRDGRFIKHRNNGPGASQDVIILQTTNRCRIEIPVNDLPRFIQEITTIAGGKI